MGSSRRRRASDAGGKTRTRILAAALRTLIREGYANTSVRAIAATGGFSPALVFYHYGTVDALLIAVLEDVSVERLARYRRRLEGIGSVGELAAAMEELYAEDQRLGYLTAVQEIVGALAFDRELGALIVACMQPWMEFAESLAQRILRGSPLQGLVDPADIGTAVIALYLGLEIVTRMRAGDSTGSLALMTTLQQSAPWVDRLLGKGVRRGRPGPTRVALD